MSTIRFRALRGRARRAVVLAWSAPALALAACSAELPMQPTRHTGLDTRQDPPLLAAIHGPAVIQEKARYRWNAVATGGTGAYDYRWTLIRGSDVERLVVTGVPELEITTSAHDGDLELTLHITSGTQSATARVLVGVADARRGTHEVPTP